MECRISSNCTRNIHRPSTTKKEVNRKENTVGKIAKRRQIRKSTHAQIPILARFYSITKSFAEFDLLRFLQLNFLRFAGSLNIFVPFIVPVDKSNSYGTKFEMEEENTKRQIARRLPL